MRPSNEEMKHMYITCQLLTQLSSTHPHIKESAGTRLTHTHGISKVSIILAYRALQLLRKIRYEVF